ncbi:hypothetical protein GCM10027093_18290 [Paraburkholderia jirisanensis]
MRPPLRDHIQLTASGKAYPEPIERPIEQRPVTALKSREEKCHGREKRIGQCRVKAVKDKAIVAVEVIGSSVELIQIFLKASSNPGIAAFARGTVIEGTEA